MTAYSKKQLTTTDLKNPTTTTTTRHVFVFLIYISLTLYHTFIPFCQTLTACHLEICLLTWPDPDSTSFINV